MLCSLGVIQQPCGQEEGGRVLAKCPSGQKLSGNVHLIEKIDLYPPLVDLPMICHSMPYLSYLKQNGHSMDHKVQLHTC